VVSAFAILVAVSNSDVTRVLIDKARVSIGGAISDQSAPQAALNPPAVRQILLEVLARVSDPVTPASVNASAPRLGTPSREAIVSAYHTAQQSQVPAARTGNEGAAPSKTLYAETLAALMTRAKACWRSVTSPRRDCCSNAPPMRRMHLRLSYWHRPMIRLCSECVIREASQPTL
jgi:hypothetical protein